MASMSRLAGGLGKLLLSLLCLTGPGAIGASQWTSPVSVETYFGRESIVFQATAGAKRVRRGKKWVLRLEVRGREPRSADESE